MSEYTDHQIKVEDFRGKLEEDSSLRSQGTYEQLEVMDDKLQMKMKDIAATMELLIVNSYNLREYFKVVNSGAKFIKGTDEFSATKKQKTMEPDL